MGCVSYSLRYFEDGEAAMKENERGAQRAAADRGGSSRAGTAAGGGSSNRALAGGDHPVEGLLGEHGVTPAALDRLRSHLIKSGDMDKAELAEVTACHFWLASRY